MTNKFPMMHLIKAVDPADLLTQVDDQLRRERDMHGAMFVSDEGLLCQRTIKTLCLYEYCLVIAKDLDDLSKKENDAIEMGFDYLYGTVMWNAKYLQWMSRLNGSGVNVRDAVAHLGVMQTKSHIEHADRDDELQLVADVRKGLHMEPTALGGYVVRVLNPVMGS